jgi:hypothetical protein
MKQYNEFMVVEGTTTHKQSRKILCIFSLLFISQLPFFSTNPQQAMIIQTPPAVDNPDLLIILSPQYNQDTEILSAIHAYLTAVHNDLGWTARIIPIQKDQNTYQQIDTIIETSDHNHTVKACLMVGEDLNTALGGDTNHLEQPSILPWTTLGGTTAYESADQGIISKPTMMQICISLLYPPQHLTYEQKKDSLLFAFQKFTTQRHHPLQNTCRVFESSALNTNSKPLYQHLAHISPLEYTEDATAAELTDALTNSYTAFFVHGHSNPSGTDVAIQPNEGWFSAETLNTLQAPFFGADGCYTAGWWSIQTDNNHLDESIGTSWYAATIFSSQTIQAMALGLLSQNGFSTPVSFLENAMPDLLSGKTLAESLIGDITIGDTIIIGDPAFHYTI